MDVGRALDARNRGRLRSAHDDFSRPHLVGLAPRAERERRLL